MTWLPTRAVFAVVAALLAAGLVEAYGAAETGGRASAAAFPRRHTVRGWGASPAVMALAQRVRIVATPASGWIGQSVRLRVINVAFAPSVTYRWSLHGGAKPLDTGTIPMARVVFRRPGDHLVVVRIRQGGARLQGSVVIWIARSPLQTPIAETAAKRRREAGAATAAVSHSAAARTRTAKSPRRAQAADPVVTISDFNFTPNSITIHVGSTVTWTNKGPSAHTATAQDGSFSTGVLQRGASASHTFTRAGTFSYFCQIHPFMRGTIVVVGAAHTGQPKAGSPAPPAQRAPGAPAKARVSTSSRGSRGGPAAAASLEAGATSAGTLPMTGLNLRWTALCGLGLVAAGLVLRRAVRRNHQKP